MAYIEKDSKHEFKPTFVREDYERAFNMLKNGLYPDSNFTLNELGEEIAIEWFDTHCFHQIITNGLAYADLSGMNLSYISCPGLDFRGANLQGCMIKGSDFRHSIFSGADLSGCVIDHTRMSNSSFNNTNFTDSEIIASSFEDSVLQDANFENATIKLAVFNSAVLVKANFNNARLINMENLFFNAAIDSDNNLGDLFPLACPKEGSFIGWKVGCDIPPNASIQRRYIYGENLIIKLEIPADAKRLSGFGNKCRCDKAKILDIFCPGTHVSKQRARSKFYGDLIYEVGKTVCVDNFDENRWHECSYGIHFVMTQEELKEYMNR